MNDGLMSGQVTPSSSLVAGRPLLVYPRLCYPWLVHGTVVMKDRLEEGPGAGWRAALARFMAGNVSPAPVKVVVPAQVHGNRVLTAGAAGPAAAGKGGPPARACVPGSGQAPGGAPVAGPVVESPECDGLVTSESGVMIGVNTADCVPLIAVDESAGAVGVAHCGWRGIAAGVVESLVREFRKAAGIERGGRGAAAVFLIGSSIGPCCYEVGGDLLDAFDREDVEKCVLRHGSRTALDLRRLVALRLADEGIDRAGIFTDNACTCCDSDFLCSFRADGDGCGRMYTFLMKIAQ